MTKDARLRAVGHKFIKLSHARFGVDCDPTTKVEELAREVEVDARFVLSAICAARE